jgi:hypothetical protein
MRRAQWSLAAAAAITAASLAVAQGANSPAYHLKNEVVVHGTVTSVKTIPDWMGKDGVNIALESPATSWPHVDVAPASFLRLLDFPIEVGDELELKGCASEVADGSAVFLVHEMKKRKVMVNVRDPEGAPLW